MGMASRESLRGFLERIDTIINTDGCLVSDFQSLKQQSQRYKVEKTFSTIEGEKPCNFKKNRFRDILPFDRTRIVLQEIEDVEGSDYINANYLKGNDGSSFYIAAQGPLSNAVCDFWRMIWEKHVNIIVMAGREYEMGKYKCYRYWVTENEETTTFGDIDVNLISETSITEEYLIRIMKITKGEEEREVTQIHYHMWPDHGVPSSFTPLIDVLRIIRDLQPHNQIPIVVHCSAGCGRTGTICAVDYVWESLKKEDFSADFSIFDLISNMRTERPAIVQTQEQYEIVHITVREIASMVLREMYNDYYDHTYENLQYDEASEHLYENVEALKQTPEPEYATAYDVRPAAGRAGEGDPPPKPSRPRPHVAGRPQSDPSSSAKPPVSAKPLVPAKPSLKPSRLSTGSESPAPAQHQQEGSPPSSGDIKALIAGLENLQAVPSAVGGDAGIRSPPPPTTGTKHLLKKNSEGHLPLFEKPPEQASGVASKSPPVRPKLHPSLGESKFGEKLSEVISGGGGGSPAVNPTPKPRPASAHLKIAVRDSAASKPAGSPLQVKGVSHPPEAEGEIQAFKAELKQALASDDGKVTAAKPPHSPAAGAKPTSLPTSLPPPRPPSPKRNRQPPPGSAASEDIKAFKNELKLTFGTDDSRAPTGKPLPSPKVTKPTCQPPPPPSSSLPNQEAIKAFKEELKMSLGADDSKASLPAKPLQSPKFAMPQQLLPSPTTSSKQHSQHSPAPIGRKLVPVDNSYEYIAPDISEKPPVEEGDSGSKGFAEAKSKIEATFILSSEKPESGRKISVGLQSEKNQKISVGNSPEIAKRHKPTAAPPIAAIARNSPPSPKDNGGGGDGLEYSYIPVDPVKKSLVLTPQKEESEALEVSWTGAGTTQGLVHAYKVVNPEPQEELATSASSEGSGSRQPLNPAMSPIYEIVNSEPKQSAESRKVSEIDSPPPVLPERTKYSYEFIDLDSDLEEPHYQPLTPADLPQSSMTQSPSQVSISSSESLHTPSKTSNLAAATGDTSITKKIVANTMGIFKGIKHHSGHKKEKYSLQPQADLSNPTYGESDAAQAISYKTSNNSELSYPNRIGKPKGPREAPKSWQKPSLSNL